MSLDFPLVTVVALCYNHSRYVVDTLESIRNQTYSNIEVVLVDDCSKDNSVSVVEEWLKQHGLDWPFVRHQQNKGVTKTLNETLELAKGKYFKVVACDDVLLPQFVDKMVSVMEALPEEYAMVYSDVVTMDENSRVFGETPFTQRGWDSDDKVPSGMLFDQLAGWCFIPAPGTFMRTEVLKKIRFDESLSYEDWDMWLSISKVKKIKGISERLVYYRVHSRSMFQEASADFIRSSLETAQKHMGFSEVADLEFRKFIIEWSLKNHFKNGRNQVYWFWKRFVYQKNFRNLYKVVTVLIGVRHTKM